MPVARVAITILMIYMAGYAVLQKFVLLPRLEDGPQGRYGRVFAQLSREQVHRVVAVDSGVPNDDGLVAYTPQLDFYELVWRARGLDVQRPDSHGLTAPAEGETVVTCDPFYLGRLRARGASRVDVPGCAAVEMRPEPGAFAGL